MFRIGRKTITAAVILSLASPAFAEDTVKMGALATLEGAFTVPRRGQHARRSWRWRSSATAPAARRSS